jgi:hypothetical protein
MKSAYGNLSESQVKALFVVAAKPQRRSPGPYLDLLDRAAKETTSVQELTDLKEQAKRFIKDANDLRHREAATLLYHVAVASAFVHHGAAISGRPMGKQQSLYEQFASTWAGHPIGQLFRDAADRVARNE